jgi:hypothetical protein
MGVGHVALNARNPGGSRRILSGGARLSGGPDRDEFHRFAIGNGQSFFLGSRTPECRLNKNLLDVCEPYEAQDLF